MALTEAAACCAATRALLEVVLCTRRGVAWLEAQPAAVGALLQVLHPGCADLPLQAADTADFIRCHLPRCLPRWRHSAYGRLTAFNNACIAAPHLCLQL